MRAGTGPAPLIGVFFLLMTGLLGYGLLGGFVNLNDLSVPERALAWVVGLGVGGAGVWVLHSTRAHSTVFDALRRTVVVERRAPFHTARQELHFAEVFEALVLREMDSEGDPIYGVGLLLGGDERTSLSPQAYVDEAECQRVADEVNRFLGGAR